MSLLSFLPSIVGLVGSLFKGKKAQYSTQQNPQQSQAYQQLLSQLMSRMRGGFQSPAQTQGQQSIGRLNNMFWK